MLGVGSESLFAFSGGTMIDPVLSLALSMHSTKGGYAVMLGSGVSSAACSVPQKLDSGRRRVKVGSSHEKTLFGRLQSPSGTGVAKRREELQPDRRRARPASQPA